VPADTLRQAQRYFARLDKFNARDDAQHDLFAAAGAPPAQAPAGASAARLAELESKLAALDPDQLSPRDALAALYELKRAARDG
jgi:DNA mismatch repair protein MutS